jgi:penicillin amidase
VPIRRKGDGSLPQPGWTSEYDWAGFVPFDDLPRVFNPPGGLLVNANARLVPDDYKPFITRDWAAPYRQRRANELLNEVDRHAVYGMIAIQADILAAEAGDILPALLKPEPSNPRTRQARDLLARWNRFMLSDRPEPLIYAAWLMELQRGLFQARVGDELFASMAHPHIATLLRVLNEKPEWCDNPGTSAKETCDDAIMQALERALDGISRRQGSQIEAWRWGREHRLAYVHPLFDRIPVLRDIASVRFPADGGSETLNRADFHFSGNQPFEANHGATFRGVYDFSDLDNSRFALPLGQSGNIFSPYARNFVERWRKLSYIEIPGNRAEVARTAAGVIQLSPR